LRECRNHKGHFTTLKDYLYNGPGLAIRNDGLRIKKRKLTLSYQDISSIGIRKARLTRGWLGLILLGIILITGILCLLYLFLAHFYFISDVHGAHYHYARRSPGIIIGILVILPVIIFLRIKKYFRKQVMLIIKWDHDEFRIKFSELNITENELKRYLEGKAIVITSELM
jgi:hypothetical protein